MQTLFQTYSARLAAQQDLFDRLTDAEALAERDGRKDVLAAIGRIKAQMVGGYNQNVALQADMATFEGYLRQAA